MLKRAISDSQPLSPLMQRTKIFDRRKESEDQNDEVDLDQMLLNDE